MAGERAEIEERPKRYVAKLRRELGPVCQKNYFDDPTSTELYRNEDGSLWVEEGGKDMVRVGEMSELTGKGKFSNGR